MFVNLATIEKIVDVFDCVNGRDIEQAAPCSVTKRFVDVTM